MTPTPAGLGPPQRAVSSVLLISNEYPPEKIAGTAMATQFLAQELARRGVRVTVVVNTRRSVPPREVDGLLEIIRLRPLPLPFTRMAQRAALIARIAARRRPSIIQGQSLSCGAVAVVTGRLTRTPAAVYIQGLDLYESSRWARSSYIRWTLRRADAVIAVTDDLRMRAAALSGRRAAVIPHGVQRQTPHALTREEARAWLDLPPDAPLLLYVGRLIGLKGVNVLIAALSRVLAQHPTARLVVVGDGEDRAALEAQVRALRLDPHVMFAGAQAHEKVIGFMRASDVFALPSFVEAFGIVLVEAMSCGLPIVASRVMGIPSLVEDGVNGFLVPPGDPQALADRLAVLLGDRGLRIRIGSTNAAGARAYAVSTVADRFLKTWTRATILRTDECRSSV